MNHVLPKHPLLLKIQKKLELPMLILSFVWFCVLIAELVYGLIPALYHFGTVIWILYICYLAIRLAGAPSRLVFFRKNWLFILAIFVSVLRLFPFLQPFRMVRVITATFGVQAIWIFASADQGMRSLRRTLGRRGAG